MWETENMQILHETCMISLSLKKNKNKKPQTPLPPMLWINTTHAIIMGVKNPHTYIKLTHDYSQFRKDGLRKFYLWPNRTLQEYK